MGRPRVGEQSPLGIGGGGAGAGAVRPARLDDRAARRNGGAAWVGRRAGTLLRATGRALHGLPVARAMTLSACASVGSRSERQGVRLHRVLVTEFGANSTPRHGLGSMERLQAQPRDPRYPRSPGG